MILTPRLSAVQIRNLHHQPSKMAVREEAAFDRVHPEIAAELHAVPKADAENAWVAVLQDADRCIEEFWLRQKELYL